MYVDWMKTGVKGWAKPQDKVDTTVDSPSPDYKLLPTDLWYGSAPTKIGTEYRETKQAKGSSPDTVRSRIHMAVPADPKHAAATLVSIEVEFMSEVWGGQAVTSTDTRGWTRKPKSGLQCAFGGKDYQNSSRLQKSVGRSASSSRRKGKDRHS
jgi:hypothetical protein